MVRSMRGIVQKAGQIRSKPSIKNQPWFQKLDLLKTLVQRDLEVRHKGSVLGNIWPLLNQLSQLIIYTYVFSIVLKVKLSLSSLPENNLIFGLWLFAGLLSWEAFRNGFLKAAESVVGQPNLVKKVVFPLNLLPLVATFSSFIESSFGLMALLVLLTLSTQTLQATLWLLPLVWIPQLLFTAGFAYLGAALTVFVRDIPQTAGMILNFWFYFTPICYPAEIIPPGLRELVFWINPMAAFSAVYRDLILLGEVRHLGEWLVASVVSCLVFGIGFWVYQRLRPAFADVL